MSLRLESFLKRIEVVAISTAERLESDLSVSLTRADTKEENAFQELFELELRQQEDFHSVVDEILDAVEERFELLKAEGFTRDRSDWPLLWQVETTDPLGSGPATLRPCRASVESRASSQNWVMRTPRTSSMTK
jgi:hypothetical protein